MLEFVGAIDPTKSEARVLDKLKVEKERGITVKAQTASVIYSEYVLVLLFHNYNYKYND